MTRLPIKALLLDMDGVLWRDTQPIGDLPAIFSGLQKKGLRAAFITNNATRTANQYVEKLTGFGIRAEPQQVYTSARAAAEYLAEQHPNGGPVFVVGEDGLSLALKERGFLQDGKAPLAVVVGLDRFATYDKLSAAALFVRAGVPFIGTNPDRTLPTPQGLVPGAGSLIAAIEAATDVKATIIGKPQPTMFLQALKDLRLKPKEALVVGDRLETDIAGGQAAGCPTALVLSGVTTKEQARAWLPAPDWITPDLASLVKKL